MINLGAGGGAKDKKKVKSKKPKMINVNAKDGDEEEVEEKPKVVEKMDLNALLAAPKKTDAGGGAPMSLADRMKMMQKKKDPE